MPLGYSLVLSKGTHLIDESARTRVLAAVESGARVVEVELDRYQDGTPAVATVITAHVVAIFPLEDDRVALPANVTPLVRRA